MISFIILVSITIALLYMIGVSLDHLRIWRMYKKCKLFSGPPAYPLIGNGLYLLGSSGDLLNRVMELCERYPTPFRFWMGTRLFVLTIDPEQVKVILNSPMCIEKAEIYKYLQGCVGNGLFTAPAVIWRRHRKFIMPTFNQKILESFVETFHEKSLLLTRHWENKLDQKDIDVFDDLQLCGLDIICETAMGVDMQLQSNNNFHGAKALGRVLELCFFRASKFWYHSDIIFNLTPHSRVLRNMIKCVHDMTEDVIQNKRHIREKTIPESGTFEFNRQKKVFLDLLMEPQNGTKFTDKELRDEITTMLIAGSDTTATTVLFAMLMLADFPEVQSRVYDELFAIYGSNESESLPIKCEDLQRMEYLERVIKETLRLFPVGAILMRKVTEDVDLGECILPEGCTAAIVVISLHRSEKLWTKPLEFDPDRFLPENVSKRQPYSYIPFSAGPRSCVGYQFAMMEAKTIIATILRKYVLRNNNTVPITDIKVKMDVVLKPVNPIKLQIIRRA